MAKVSYSVSVSDRMGSEVSGVYLQPSDFSGVGGERDSGYDSLRRKMSVLDRLTQTHPVWLLLAVSEEEAHHILLKQQPGVRGCHPWISASPSFYHLAVFFYFMTCESSLVQVFLVSKSAALQRKVLSVRLKEDQSGTPVSHFPVRESQYSKQGVGFISKAQVVPSQLLLVSLLGFVQTQTPLQCHCSLSQS